MGSDKGQVGTGVTTSDFAGRDLGPWGLEDHTVLSSF